MTPHRPEKTNENNGSANKPPLLIIVGPTAVGKTEFCVRLAQRLNSEIVTADSMQVYRGMDIGTAKPDEKEQRGIVHHGISFVDPRQRFNVSEYRLYALDVIADIHARGKLPILSGGTGFYVKAVIDDFLFPDGGADWSLRRRLEVEAERIGRPALHRRLAAIDPETAARLHPNDMRRVIRALEVYETTGKTMSEHMTAARGKEPQFDVIMFGLHRPRRELYERINERVHGQIRRGLVAEVEALVEQGVGPDAIAMQGLGYKEIVGYLQGRYDLDEAITLLQGATRRYARRQLTWFRADKRVQWLEMGADSPMDAAVDTVLAEVARRWPRFSPSD